MKKIISSCLVVAVLTGCSGVATMNQDFTMTGSEAGIRAFADTLNGVMKTAKESPEAHSEYFAARNFQEVEKTRRENVTFLDSIFGTTKEAK